MIRSLVVVLLALLVSPALAANPVKVQADTFVVDQARSLATFTGNVIVTRTDLTIWADEVQVSYGGGGVQDIKTLTAIGSVRLKTRDQEATGARATFNPTTQILRLSGDVTVVNASGTLNGPELVLDLVAQTATFTSAGGGRVTGVFTPQ
ncbi:MAG TPA: lipopolysaccharide transport periplasmic protein LptA [Alphaproteobacteria bacterium]|nr:lipopolysaccharide transport periplasmic protein LptA [Alphaproteobacteria bacterium]